jgi:hypothetical protein
MLQENVKKGLIFDFTFQAKQILNYHGFFLIFLIETYLIT